MPLNLAWLHVDESAYRRQPIRKHHLEIAAVTSVEANMIDDKHAAEARERWGHTDAYKQSSQRVDAYTDTEWAAIKAESDDISAAFVALMETGAPADGPAAMALAEQHRAHITKWFYDCPIEMHGALGRLYVSDPRFKATIDEAAPGLAVYMAHAFAANADGAVS